MSYGWTIDDFSPELIAMLDEAFIMAPNPVPNPWIDYSTVTVSNTLPNPWAGYYPFVFPQPGTPDPDPDPPADATPKTLLEVGDRHEHKVSKLIEDMPEVERQMMYKYLYARGLRIDSCNHKIDNELAKEWRAIKNAKS